MTKQIYAIGVLLASAIVFLAPVSGQANPSVMQPERISQSGEAATSEQALQRALQLFEGVSSAPVLIPATMRRESSQSTQPRRHFDSNFILGGAEAFPM